MSAPPDGWFLRNLLYFGHEPEAPAWIARGARLTLPDLRQASAGAQEERYGGVQAFLAGMQPGEAFQAQWSRESDYQVELDRYAEVTRTSGATGWCLRCREERHGRYLRRLTEGTLRRERVEVFLGRRIPGSGRLGSGAERVFQSVLDQEAREMEVRFQAMARSIPGCALHAMDDEAHHASWSAFLQPGSRVRGQLDPAQTLLENCLPSDGVAVGEPAVTGFRLDGRQHAILVLRQWPQQTWFGSLWPLLDAAVSNVRVTLSARPMDIATLVKAEEDDIRRLEGQAGTEKKPSLAAVAARKRARIAELQSGAVRPFMALMIIRAWDVTDEGLASQVAALKTAISGMAGARYHQADQPAQTRNLFFESLPGWFGGGYRAWDRLADSTFLPDLIPLSSSFEGDLAEGHALYDGPAGGLAGVSGFPGGTPAHGLVIGMTRSGKSALVMDYLSQTDSVVHFRSIIEEGYSYGTIVELLGGRPVLVRTDGGLTLNPFDTQGQPLSRLHYGALVSLLLLMSGTPAEADTAARRKAMLADYVQQIYDDAYTDWCRRNPARATQVSRWSLLLARVGGAGPAADAFERVKGEWEGRPEALALELSAADEEELLRHVCSPGSRSRMRELACAFYDADDFPTLGGLWELLRYDPMPHHRREDCEQLSVTLAAWTSAGAYGAFFDGASNLSLDGRLVHFELGALPRSAKELKSAVLYHVFNYSRQRITGLPRAQRKEIVLEEPARYLGEAGVEDILEECYAQLGKHGCRLLPVTQQYAQLARSRVRPVVLGNSSRVLLMRQNERRDLDDLARDIEIADSMKDEILAFPRPVDLPERARYASVALLGRGGGEGSGGVIRHFASPEMRIAAESAGEVFDRMRPEGARSAADALQAVRAELERGIISTPGCSPGQREVRAGLRAADREGSGERITLDMIDGGLGDRPLGEPDAVVARGTPGVSIHHGSSPCGGRKAP